MNIFKNLFQKKQYKPGSREWYVRQSSVCPHKKDSREYHEWMANCAKGAMAYIKQDSVASQYVKEDAYQPEYEYHCQMARMAQPESEMIEDSYPIFLEKIFA